MVCSEVERDDSVEVEVLHHELAPIHGAAKACAARHTDIIKRAGFGRAEAYALIGVGVELSSRQRPSTEQQRPARIYRRTSAR